MSFCMDAECLWTQRGDGNRNHYTNLSRGAYGPKTGLPRILNVLDKHDIKATFNLPAWCCEQHTAAYREVVARGHEIAFHGYEHEEKGANSREEEEAIMDKSEKIIQDLLGVKMIGHHAPAG